MNIFETLKKLSDGNGQQGDLTIQKLNRRKEPSYIYLDEKDNQIKEIPLSRLDSAGALINKAMKKKKDPVKIIQYSIFGKS